MNKIFEWTKQNKFATFVIFVLALMLILNNKRYPIPMMNLDNNLFSSSGVSSYKRAAAGVSEAGFSVGAPTSDMMFRAYPSPVGNTTPIADTSDRKVITDASLSLQVSNVTQTIQEYKTQVATLGGFFVNSSLNKPEFGESAVVTVRVPSAQVETFITFAKGKAVKVVNENMNGSDITDQYVDIQTRLVQLQEQLVMLNTILRSAKNVDEIMKVRPYITQVQSEIDSLKGQQKYLDSASQSSLLTIYLSTDDLSLPYTPDKSWRPQVVYKNAMRSLIGSLEKMGSALIWLGVYSVIIIPALTIAFIIYLIVKKRNRHN